MLDILKVILIFVAGVLISFGFWYLIFWFISGEANLFAWYWLVKLFYLFFGFTSLGKIFELLLEI